MTFSGFERIERPNNLLTKLVLEVSKLTLHNPNVTANFLVLVPTGLVTWQVNSVSRKKSSNCLCTSVWAMVSHPLTSVTSKTSQVKETETASLD